MPVSDRGTLEGLTQFATQFGFWAEPLARKPLILKTRRDVRVVEGARLEIGACEERRGIRRDINAHALNELAAGKYLSV